MASRVTESTSNRSERDMGGQRGPAGLSTAVVLVTRNRLELLKRSLESVLNQTLSPDRIVVVDNNSTDGTSDWLREFVKDRPHTELILLAENKGSSGGFSLGMRAAYEAGADWIWTLDDDVIADPDALEQLVARIKPLSPTALKRVGYVCSKVVWTDGSRHRHNVPVASRFWWDGYEIIPGSIQLDAATFVSALFSRTAVKAVGFPVEEFFMWWDDVEYTLRLSDAGFWGYHVDESRVMHLTAENKTSDYCFVNEENVWRYHYGFRNQVAVLKSRKRGWIMAFWKIVVTVVEMLQNRVPVRLILPLALSGFKGYFFNYRKFIIQAEKA